jgi:hypothetical protein
MGKKFKIEKILKLELQGIQKLLKNLKHYHPLATDFFKLLPPVHSLGVLVDEKAKFWFKTKHK